jgi:hypothetical protein
MIAILPVSLLAQDTQAAMLRSNGIGVILNKNPAPASFALFPNDLVETQKNAAARIEASGSTADINVDTMVQFEGNELVLDHGSLSVNTSHGLRVRVGCLTIAPVNDTVWTHYDLVDVDGKVAISALKSDVYIDAHTKNLEQAKQPARSNRVIVHESERKSREEKCGAAYMLTTGGAILNSPWAIGAGIVAVGVMTCLGLICRNGDPMSPTKP